jgi:hypothetical protein
MTGGLPAAPRLCSCRRDRSRHVVVASEEFLAEPRHITRNWALPRPRNLHMNAQPRQQLTSVLPVPCISGSPMHFRRIRIAYARGRCTVLLAALAFVACDDPVCPSGTTARIGHCVLNNELTDAAVGTAGQQASKASAGTPAISPAGASGGGAGAKSDPANSSETGGTGSGRSTIGSAGTAAESSDGDAGGPEPKCGNGIREGKELCDGTDCISSCEIANSCLTAALIGAAATCDAQCGEVKEITECKSGDGCCARGCTHAEDTDCSKSCGDGVVEAPELCEPTSSDRPCPTSCDDGDPCSSDTLTGTSEQCSATCSHAPITRAIKGDSCCPAHANANDDSDCSPQCGNGVREGSETCDGRDCPTEASCVDDDPCTMDVVVGGASSCNAHCEHRPKDPTGPAECNDGDPCTVDSRVASTTSCTFRCEYTTISRAVPGDSCCPRDANANDDSDCAAKCGNGVIESGEECEIASRSSGSDGLSAGTVYSVWSCDPATCKRRYLFTPCDDVSNCGSGSARECFLGVDGDGHGFCMTVACDVGAPRMTSQADPNGYNCVLPTGAHGMCIGALKCVPICRSRSDCPPGVSCTTSETPDGPLGICDF